MDLFELVDGRVPDTWVAARDEEGDLSLLPELFHDKYFIDDLFEGKREAVVAFQQARAALDTADSG